jgi:Glycosyltransferases involved in cell wall biogenesis
MKILAIIPAYNEEETISSVIEELRQIMLIDILVVNDGSKDKTSSIAHTLNVNVIDFPHNKGIGSAMKTGYQYARENGYDIAIQTDADGQHDLTRINELIKMITEEKYDLAIGSRYVVKTNYISSFCRYWGAKYFSFLIKILNHKIIRDTTSGYRAVNNKVIDFFADHYLCYYPEVPMLLELLMRNYKVCETPVEMKKRQGGKSSISFIGSIIYFFKITLICIKKYILIKIWRTE